MHNQLLFDTQMKTAHSTQVTLFWYEVSSWFQILLLDEATASIDPETGEAD